MHPLNKNAESCDQLTECFFFGMRDEEAFLQERDEAEMELCAKLQWLVNYWLAPDCARPYTGTETFWNVQHYASRRLGPIKWSVFDDATRRFIIFRGYSIGTCLPVPFPILISGDTRPVVINAVPYIAWRIARGSICSFLNTDKDIIVSGYSIGTASAMLTATHNSNIKRMYLFSPFPFCERKFFDTIRVSYIQIWLQGDYLTRCYNPIFVISSRNTLVLPAQRKFSTIFGYHSSESIALSISEHPEALAKEMSRIAV